MAERCGSCRYYDARGGGDGVCRADPPYGSTWPEVDADHDWCGRHTPADPPRNPTVAAEVEIKYLGEQLRAARDLLVIVRDDCEMDGLCPVCQGEGEHLDRCAVVAFLEGKHG